MFSATPSAKDQNSQSGQAAPSLISHDVVITGLLQSSGDIQIDGRVEGHVRAAGLVIGETASIHGEIQAEHVIVRGKVEGSIHARKVALAAGCHVLGDIIHATLEVEFGAFMQGQVGHSAEPLAEPLLPLEEDAERRSANSPMRQLESKSDEMAEDEAPRRIAAAG